MRSADRNARLTFRLGRMEWGGLLFLTLLAVLVRVVGAGAYHGYAYDEAYYVATAQNLLGLPMLHGSALTGPITRFTDPNLFSAPPFGKELIAAAIWLFGNHPWAWRLPGGLLGASLPAAGFFLARFLFPKPRLVAWTAGFFLTFEGLGIGLSRAALLDSTVVPLAVWGILVTVVAGVGLVAEHTRTSQVLALLGGGALLGLALATKWTGAQALLAAAGILAVGFFSALRQLPNPRAWPVLRTLLLYAAALVVVPLAVYVATYLWGAGPTGFANGVPAAAGFLGGVVYIQHRLLDAMWALQFTHPWLAPAWSWFLVPRPIYLVSQHTGSWHSAVYALSNPWWVWMGGVGLLLGLVKLLRPGLLPALPGPRASWMSLWIWTAAFYGTWFLTPRSKFDYYFYPMTVAVALAAAAIPPLLRRPVRPQWALRAYWTLLVLTTLYLFPLWVGISLPNTLSYDLVWVPTWGPIPSSSSVSVPAPSTVVSLHPLHGEAVPGAPSALPATISAAGYGPTHEAFFGATFAALNLGLPAGGPVDGTVAVTAGGDVYAGTTADQVLAISARSGLRLWTATVPNQVMTMPLVVPGKTQTLVVVGLGNAQFRGYNRRQGWIRGTGENGLAAFDAATGREVWMAHTTAEDMANPVYQAGMLYEVTGSGRFLAVNADTGRIQWSLQLVGFDSLSGLQYVNGHVLVATNEYLVSYPARSSTLWSIDVATHRVAWSTTLPAKSGLSDCSVAVLGDTAYIAGVSRIRSTSPLPTLTEQLYAVNATSGRVIWMRPLGAGHLSLNQAEVATPLATPGAVFIANPASGVAFAFTPSGTPLWHTSLAGGAATGAPVLAGDRLYWATGTSAIDVLGAGSGQVMASVSLPTGPIGSSSPVMVGNSLWFGTQLGYIDSLAVEP
ncbi:MAG: PQQ-binding-like beta-propeller repeat protein [Clostridia bacterium]